MCAIPLTDAAGLTGATGDARTTDADRRITLGPILVATRGGDESDAALYLARLLAGHAAADVRCVSVVEPAIIPDPGTAFAPPPSGVSPERMSARRSAVEAQLSRTELGDSGWPLDVVVGVPSRQIAAWARQTGAGLVVLGRTGNRLEQRTAGGELARALVRLASVPVLGVVPSLTTLPRRVLVAADFSPYSVHAARVALALCAPDAVVHLVHVQPAPHLVRGGDDGWRWRDGSTRASFDRLLAELPAEGRLLEPVTLFGDPVSALGDFAHAAGSDLVAIGAHGRGFLDRLVLGSVSAGLLRRSPCSVLCVPGSALARAAQRRWQTAGLITTHVPRDRWASELEAIARHAGGRPCSVEIDTPELGAQSLVEGLPLAGAAVDPDAQCVTLMLGALDGMGGHLSHAVTPVTGIDVVTDHRGAPRVLRLSTADGQTLVYFGG